MFDHALKLGYLLLLHCHLFLLHCHLLLLRLDNSEEFFLLRLQLLLKRRNLLVFSFGSIVQLLDSPNHWRQ